LSEPTCGSTQFEEDDEFGCVDSYSLEEKMRESPHFHEFLGVECYPCGVNLGFGHCHRCLQVAVLVFRDEDELDEL